MNLTTWEGEKTVYDLYFDAAVFFICREALSATLKKQGMIYFLLFARSLSDKIAFLHTCLSFALVRARRSRCEWESKERERERSEVVVGRYAHHKFYFCRETDGQKKSCAQAAQSVRFFSPFFCDNFATKTNHGIVWAIYSVSVSRYFFCFVFFRDFCPLNVVFLEFASVWVGGFLECVLPTLNIFLFCHFHFP